MTFRSRRFRSTHRLLQGESLEERRLLATMDFGDAPFDLQQTMLAFNGARHTVGGPYLGGPPDAEDDGQPTLAADGDGADEDGVDFPPVLVPGQTAYVTVHVVGAGKLDAWIDLNNNHIFFPSDKIASGLDVVTGDVVLPIVVPLTAPNGTVYARFRISTAGTPNAGGPADDGEVEDYAVTVFLQDANTAQVVDDPNHPGEHRLLITGGPKNDRVQVFPVGGNTRVTLGTRIVGTFPSGDFERIAILTYGGNDDILIDPRIGKPTEIYGGSGSDTIYGGSGADTIYGGSADDRIFGGAGDDTVFAEDGKDTVHGQAGNDEIHGGRGVDLLLGDAGNDTIFGDEDSDTIHGGDGNDLIFAGVGGDLVYGDNGNDVLLGDYGTDRLYGGKGRDLLIGGGTDDPLDKSIDKLFGEDGEDLLINGRTSFDADPAALGKIMAEWTSARSYSERVDNLRTGGGPVLGGTALQVGVTVFQDDDADELRGGGGLDWFFTAPPDKLLDRTAAEELN